MLVRVTVDPDACIGSAECVALDPEAIELDEHGTARLLIADLDEERANELCETCPVGALTAQPG
jgi:ferredoxin